MFLLKYMGKWPPLWRGGGTKESPFGKQSETKPLF